MALNYLPLLLFLCVNKPTYWTEYAVDSNTLQMVSGGLC